jgi:hypothetical protein
MVESATLFRRAAGVFRHLAVTVLPPLQPVLPPDRCPEATVSMASIMSIVCLAEAQAVTVRRAEEKATSGGLLAKLHYGVVQFLEEAATLLRAHIGDWNDVSDKLRRYISICSVLHESRSQRFIAAEYTKIERFGVAVGVLRYSLSRVQQVRPTSTLFTLMNPAWLLWFAFGTQQQLCRMTVAPIKMLIIYARQSAVWLRHDKPLVLVNSLNNSASLVNAGDDTWKIAFRQEQDALQNMLRKCDNENDFIWHEKIPRKDELPVLEGLKIVALIAYQPFGLDREFIFIT